MPGIARRRFLTLSASALGTVAVGAAGAQAAPQPRAPWLAPTGCTGDPAHPKRQLRGVWIATVTNDNWPSAAGLPAEQQQAELVALLDAAASLRMNAVYFQIRPSADALYTPGLEPWSQYLTGTQGVSPGYDPLEFAIDQAHRRNLELHAWMNPYRVSLQPDLDQLVAWHPARRHPDWVVSYGGELYYNPGIPEVLDFDLEVIADVVRRYDVDGIHFDDYFYPYPVGTEEFDDDATFARYGRGFATKDDWRRDNINRLVRSLNELIPSIKPWVKWGISPFGIWRNASTDPRGSQTDGLQSYDAIYADTRGWVLNNWLDYVAPQLYWNIGFPPAAYDKLVPWWSDVVADSRVQLVIGQDVAKIGTSDPSAWLNPDEMPDHLILNREYPQVAGDIFFDITKLLTDPLGFESRLANDLYAYPALVPEMPRLPGDAPAEPRRPQVKTTSAGVELRWPSAPRSLGVPAAYYAVYRFDGVTRASGCDFDDARHLLGTVRATAAPEVSWTDASAAAGAGYTYYLSALDRLHHESTPSAPGVVGA